ncbi:MAG TPA: hypothetical protein VN791_06430 [Acidimicrobiales bacterium]|nr:hypothetical protein [Acidimicrobiales bacterium]
METCTECGYSYAALRGRRTGVDHWPTTEVRTVDRVGRHAVHAAVHHRHDTGLLRESLTEKGSQR